MSELDELEEIKLQPDSTATPKQWRAARKFMRTGSARNASKPRWLLQLRAEKSWVEKRKLKAKVT